MKLSDKLKELHLALVFFTRLPIGNLKTPIPSLADSSWSWALVGSVIGMITAAFYLLLIFLQLPLPLTALLTILLMVMITGAMHEDGLADLADSFGGMTLDKKLEIMSDSRIGAFGVLALIFSIGIRATALALIDDAMSAAVSIIVIAVVSRSALPMFVWALPPIKEQGLGKTSSGVSQSNAIVSVLLGISCAIFLTFSIEIVVSVAIVSTLLYFYIKRKFKGITGDILGGAQQILEMTCWILFLI